MNIRTETKKASLRELWEMYDSDSIELDESFQVPGARWDKKKQKKYFGSVLHGYGCASKITLGDLRRLQACNEEHTSDYHYFSEKMEGGYKYLSIDGNNRTVAIVKVLNDEVPVPGGEYILNGKTFRLEKDTDFSQLAKEFSEQILSLTIEISYLVYGDATAPRNLFIAINDGIALNEWEKNNAIDSPVSRKLRECRKYESALNVIGNNSADFWNRRKADGEIFRVWFMYVLNGEVGWKPTSNREQYEHGSDLSNHLQDADHILKWLSDLISLGGSRILKANGTSSTASALGDLAMLYRYITDENYKLNDLSGFIDWWCERQNRRFKDTDTTWTFKNDTRDYSRVCAATSANHFKVRRKCLHYDFEMTYRNEQNVTQKDSRRAFSRSYRYRKWEDQKGICPLTEKVIPQTEIDNGSLWQLDHITPHSKGGPTTYENCQLVCAEANRNKSDK